jgi:spore germination protein KB
MPDKEQINTNQFIWMLFIIITSVTLLQAPGILLKTGQRDAWMSVAGGIILDILLAIAYSYLGMRFPKENFVQYSSSILGRTGKVVGLAFPFFFLLSSILIIRSFSMVIHTAFLPKTPLPVIAVSTILVVAYAVRKGIEVIARVAEVLGPIYLISAIFISFLLVPSAEIDRILPIMENGILPVVRGSFFIVTYYGICIMMAMFIPISNKPEYGFLSKVSAVTMGGFMVGFVVLFSTMLFGYKQAVNKLSPSLSLLRVTSISHFFERFEMLWMLIAVGAAILAASQMIWAFCVGVAQTVGLPDYKQLVNSSCLLAIVLETISFNNQGFNGEFLQFTFPNIAFLVETVLELFLLIMAIILNKGKKGTFRTIRLLPRLPRCKTRA